jgi:hypothetical protein
VDGRFVHAELLAHLALEQFQEDAPPPNVITDRFELVRRPGSAREVVRLRQYNSRWVLRLGKSVRERDLALLHAPDLGGVGPNALYRNLVTRRCSSRPT